MRTHPDELWLFIFHFTSAYDRDVVLDNEPWMVDDATLALEQ